MIKTIFKLIVLILGNIFQKNKEKKQKNKKNIKTLKKAIKDRDASEITRVFDNINR